MSEKLEIEKDRVLVAMAKCEQFKTIAVELWPELKAEGWKKCAYSSSDFFKSWLTETRLYLCPWQESVAPISIPIKAFVIDNKTSCKLEFRISDGIDGGLFYREKK